MQQWLSQFKELPTTSVEYFNTAWTSLTPVQVVDLLEYCAKQVWWKERLAQFALGASGQPDEVFQEILRRGRRSHVN